MKFNKKKSLSWSLIINYYSGAPDNFTTSRCDAWPDCDPFGESKSKKRNFSKKRKKVEKKEISFCMKFK